MIAQLVNHPVEPQAKRRPTARALAAVVLAFAFVAAACGGGSEDAETQAETVEETDDLAFGNDGEDRPTTTTTAEPEPEMADESSGDVDEMSTTPTTAGSGLNPVNTVAVGSGGDPDNIYIGRLGTLDPDEPQVPGVVVPPNLSPNVMPLTGEFGTVPDRPAAVVKIDNGSAASPHQGLNAADIVIEEEVEAGSLDSPQSSTAPRASSGRFALAEPPTLRWSAVSEPRC